MAEVNILETSTKYTAGKFLKYIYIQLVVYQVTISWYLYLQLPNRYTSIYLSHSSTHNSMAVEMYIDTYTETII